MNFVFSPHYWLRTAALVVLYALLAKVVLAYFSANGVVTIFWPPSGVALAALLLGGKKYWPGVFLGAWLANVLAGSSVTLSAFIGLGNTLEGLVGFWLLARDAKFEPALQSADSLFRLFLAGIVAPAVGALNGATTLLLAGVIDPQSYLHNLRLWWMGDALGIVLFTSTILVFRHQPLNWRHGSALEAIGILGLTFFAGQAIFLDWFQSWVGGISRGYWLYLFVTWGALRLGAHGVLAILVMTLIQALTGASQGVGFFGNDLVKTQLSNVWYYMMILTAVGMAVATIFAERKRTEQKRVSESARLQTLLETASDGIHILDMDGNVVQFSDSFARMLGYTKEEAAKLNVRDWDAQISHDRLVKAVRSLVKTPSLVETRHRRKDGSVFDVEINAKGIELDGKPYLYASTRDITERKLAAEALQKFNTTLERSVQEEVAKNRQKDLLLIQQSRLASMGEMIHNIAHQWRQPLNALGLLLANIKDSHDYKELDDATLDGLMKDGNRLIRKMSTTIDDFRNFFRPDTRPESFDIATAVEDSLVIMDAALKHRFITVRKKLPAGIMTFGYPNQFSQALLNILANAKESIQHNEIQEGCITISLDKVGNEAVLTIRDNGGGIPEETLPKIFEPYFTTKELGSGIGLYMTKMILERNMNGQITIANQEQGAFVTIHLPLIESGSSASA